MEPTIIAADCVISTYHLRGSHHPRRAGREPVEDGEGVHRGREEATRPDLATARPACTARCTWRWSCSRRRRGSSCATCRTPGGGPPLTALLGGHVDALASGPAVVLPQIKAGKLRALAGWGAERIAALPDVPTFKELGYPDGGVLHLGRRVRAEGRRRRPSSRSCARRCGQAVADPEFKAAMDEDRDARSRSSRATSSRSSSTPTPAASREGVRRVGTSGNETRASA